MNKNIVSMNISMCQAIFSVIIHHHVATRCAREFESMAIFMGEFQPSLVFPLNKVSDEIDSFLGEMVCSDEGEVLSLNDYVF